MKSIVLKVVMLLSLFCMLDQLVPATRAYAAGTGAGSSGSSSNSSVLDYMKEHGGTGGIFDGVDEKAEAVLGDAFALVRNIGIGLVIIAILFAVACYLWAKDTNRIIEYKAWLIRGIIALIMVCGIILFIF